MLRILDRLLFCVQQGESFEVEASGRCVKFFRLFADACHHAKEEDLLFPVLESRGIPREGGPIGVMLHEHAMGRQLTRAMADALEDHARGQAKAVENFCTSRRYIDLLPQHIYKEDNILFTMGDCVMRVDDQRRLCSRFCELGCQSFGGKAKEELTRIADALEFRWM